MPPETYETLAEGWIEGCWRPAGSRLQLTAAQAEWHLRDGRIAPLFTELGLAETDRERAEP